MSCALSCACQCSDWLQYSQDKREIWPLTHIGFKPQVLFVDWPQELHFSHNRGERSAWKPSPLYSCCCSFVLVADIMKTADCGHWCLCLWRGTGNMRIMPWPGKVRMQKGLHLVRMALPWLPTQALLPTCTQPAENGQVERKWVKNLSRWEVFQL